MEEKKTMESDVMVETAMTDSDGNGERRECLGASTASPLPEEPVAASAMESGENTTAPASDAGEGKTFLEGKTSSEPAGDDVGGYIACCTKYLNENGDHMPWGLSAMTVAELGIGYDGKLDRYIIPYPGDTGYRWVAAKPCFSMKAVAGYVGDTQVWTAKKPREKNDGPFFVTMMPEEASAIVDRGFKACAFGNDENTVALTRFLKEYSAGRHLDVILLATSKSSAASLEKVRVAIGGIDGIQAIATTMPVELEKLCTANKDAPKKLREQLEQMATAFPDIIEGNYEAHLSNFLKTRTLLPRAIPTGFSTLDAELSGGFKPGCYVLGGGPGAGKTTLALTFVRNVAGSGHHVLVFSLEMPEPMIDSGMLSMEAARILDGKKRREPESLVGEGYSSQDVLNPDWTPFDPQAGTFAEASKSLLALAGNISFFGGTRTAGKISETVKKARDLYGDEILVVVDYLQVIAKEDADRNSDERQAIDKILHTLEPVYTNVPVLLISSLSRSSEVYRDGPIGINDFKETGMIEYSAYAIFGLQKRGAAEKMQKRSRKDEDVPTRETDRMLREMELSILKNRSGNQTSVVPLDYIPAVNYFRMPDNGEADRESYDDEYGTNDEYGTEEPER